MAQHFLTVFQMPYCSPRMPYTYRSRFTSSCRAGYVVVGDTLLQPSVSPTGSPLLVAPVQGQEVWLMPAFYDEVWAYRVLFEKTKLLTMPKEEK